MGQICALLSGAVLCVAATGVATGAALAKEIKVGVVASYSGGAAAFGDLVTKGMELYLKKHPEAFGKNTVKLIKRDSKRPSGDIAKTAVQQLIAVDHVDMLGGFIFSPNAIASAPLATAGKVPMIVMNASTAFITKLSPYIVRVSFTAWQAAYPMGKYAIEKLSCKTAAIGYTDYAPGKDNRDAFKAGFTKAGGKIVASIPMGNPRQVPDFSPFFQRVKDLKPDCFYVFVPAGNHSAAAFKTYRDLGMAKAGIKLIGPGDIAPDSRLQEFGKGAIGLIVIHGYSADLDNPQNKAFVAAWKKAYGADTVPDYMAVDGWDGMAAIAHAIKTQKGNVTTDGTIHALKGWTFDSPRGPISIDPQTRDIIQNEYIFKIVNDHGRLRHKLLDTIEHVKDPCKRLKMGKCGS